jgi:cell division protein FtsI (penicillin-binding protein 3)
MILGRIVFLQFGDNGYWKKKSESQTLIYKRIEAERGNIYTYDQRTLATTLPTFDLRMDTRADALTDTVWSQYIDSIAQGLSQIFPSKSHAQYRESLDSARKSNNRYFLIAKKATFLETRQVRNLPLFKKGKIKSGYIEIQDNTRLKPFGNLAERTIGYVRDSGRYKKGLEGRYDVELSGENKIVLMEKVSGGVFLPVNDESDFGSKPGYDLVTTLDIKIQDITQSSLINSVRKFEADRGCAIVMHIPTGQIRAIANVKRSIDKEGNLTFEEAENYALQTTTEPGSVMKLASVLALIDEGYCEAQTMIPIGNGKIKYYDREMKDDHSLKTKNGAISLKTAFQESSNVGISSPVFKYFGGKKQDFYTYLEKFNLTKPLGIALKGEGTPVVPALKKWSGVTLPWLSIGYGLQVTPLQILNLYAAVANGGKMMKPYLVTQIKDNDQIIESFEPEVIQEEICKPTTIAQVKTMLESVIDSGTANNISSNFYKIAGKTGTSLVAEKGKYQQGKYQSTFVGYFPSDKPLYACIVVIHKPNTAIGYYGREVAAPVFKDIADRIFYTDINIHSTLEERFAEQTNIFIAKYTSVKEDILALAKFFKSKVIEPEQPYHYAQVIANQGKLVLKPMVNERKIIPNFKDMALKDAIFIAESLGLNVQVKGIGKIISQSIPPGQKALRGDIITLQLNNL